MLAVDIVKHPGFKNVTWALEPTAKGKVAVAKGRGGPFNIAYEIHGKGPIHLVVMSANNGCPLVDAYLLV
jgi:pimeloyl-ACP methyl ester carboxylesterase